MATRSRPLSPHVGIYRWQISNTLSILHRLSGVALALVFLLFAIWLVSLAEGAERYEAVTGLLQGPLGVAVALGFSAAFYFHLFNGVRHLFWDAGLGFEWRHARLSGWAVVLATALCSIGTIMWVIQ